jgi:hypothetical protein
MPSQSKKILSRIAQLRKKFNSKIIIIFNFYKLKIIFNVTHLKFVVLLTSSYSWFSQHNDFLPAKHSLRNMIQQIVLKANWNELALSCDTFISVHSFLIKQLLFKIRIPELIRAWLSSQKLKRTQYLFYHTL